MPRSISSAFREAAYGGQTKEVFLVLLALTHADLVTPIRVALNNEDVVSNGNTYQACALELILPSERDKEPPTARIRIDNVDRAIVNAIRSIADSPTVTIRLVLASDPDAVEIEWANFSLSDVSYDALVVEGTLSYEPILNEPFPADSFLPNVFKGFQP